MSIMPRKKMPPRTRKCPQVGASGAMDPVDQEHMDKAHQTTSERQSKANSDDDAPSVATVEFPEPGQVDESSSLGEENKLMSMAEKMKALEEERDFLRQTVIKLSGKRAKDKAKKILDTSTDSSTNGTDEESLTNSSTSESSDEDVKKRRQKKKAKRPHRSKSVKQSLRATTPEDVLKRYKKVLHAFKNVGSISKACAKVGVDRNTLALTAVMAEIQLVDPEFYQSIPKFRAKEEKLFDFAKRCQESLTANLRSTIENYKKARKLLPIKYKLR